MRQKEELLKLQESSRFHASSGPSGDKRIEFGGQRFMTFPLRKDSGAAADLNSLAMLLLQRNVEVFWTIHQREHKDRKFLLVPYPLLRVEQIAERDGLAIH